MSQELKDFEYFKQNQLYTVDFTTGIINTKGMRNGKPTYRIYKDVGHVNDDGYIRVHCHKHFRMKHRLLYYLFHNEIPTTGYECDHFDRNRSNNSISNIRILSKALNNTRSLNRKIVHKTPEVIHAICNALATTDMSDLRIAKKYNVSRGTVRDIKVRRSRQSIGNLYTWKHRGY